MAILCSQYNLLFIMTPRTACTAVGELLLQEYGGEYLPEEDILDQNGIYLVQKKHCTLSELLKYNVISKDYSDSLTKFTTIRNPFDNIVSLYIKKKFKYKPLLDDADSWVYKLRYYADDMKYAQTHSFDAWIFKNYKKSLIKKILGINPSMFGSFTTGVDEIIKFESLQKDFHNLLLKLNIDKKSEIPSVNKTTERGKDYQQYYSIFSRNLIKFIYQNDLKKYGYHF